MSSEALEARLDDLRQVCSAPSDAYSAGEWCEAANEGVQIALALLAALAVAREREQPWREALERVAAIDPDEFYVAYLEIRETVLAARAALVDEPAAAEPSIRDAIHPGVAWVSTPDPAAAIGRQTVDDYRQDLAKLAESQTVASVGQPPAAATLAEPGKPCSTRGGDADDATGRGSAPGSASAAADEQLNRIADRIIADHGETLRKLAEDD